MNKKELRGSFFKYIFFNILSTLGVSVYILIDTYFISKGMGPDGLTALNLCLPIFNFINGFGLMLGMGGGSKFSMLYCRIERAETDKIYTNAFYAAILISACFMLTGVFLSEPVTRMLGADETVFELAHSYLKTVLLFTPAFILNNLLVCFMRNDGAPRLAMAGVLGGSLANILLDYVFIFQLEWGMKGAALATCISPLISMAIMSVHFMTGWNAFKLRPVLPSVRVFRTILSLGAPTFVTECSGGIVIMVFNFVIYRICGNTGIAAYGIVANLAIVFTAIFTGLSSGVQPLLCKHHGRRDGDSVRYLLRLSLRTAILLAAAAYAAVWVYTSELVAVFSDEADGTLVTLAETGLRLYFVYLPFMGMNSVFSVYFTSCEKPRISRGISLLRGAVLVVPLACLFWALHSMKGIWLTVPAAELLTAIGAVVIYYYSVKPYSVYVYQYIPNRKKTNNAH